MNVYAKWFSGIVWLGVIINILLSIIALFSPEKLLEVVNLEPAIPTVWVRFSGNLLILLSLFYIPPAINLYHYRTNAWLAVFCRFVGLFFFLTQPRDYLIFGLFDISFGVPEGILLWLALKNG